MFAIIIFWSLCQVIEVIRTLPGTSIIVWVLDGERSSLFITIVTPAEEVGLLGDGKWIICIEWLKSVFR